MILNADDFVFRTTIETRWRDMDAFGHVNNAVYVSYLENARAAFFNELVTPPRARWTAGAVVARTKISYRKQIKYPDIIHACLQPRSIKRSTFLFRYALWNDTRQEWAVDAESLMVWVDLTSGKQSRMPDETYERLQELALPLKSAPKG